MTVATATCAMARHDARLVLVQKEQEVADVRRRALEQLEEQVCLLSPHPITPSCSTPAGVDLRGRSKH
jgi:hypothetical protein